jgi:hypothetical protein
LGFSFSAPDYPKSEFVRYAYYLEGIEAGWSEWNTKTEVLLNHLRPGDYTFHVKAKNQHHVESEVLSYSFTILPPWYANRLAYVDLPVAGFRPDSLGDLSTANKV